MSNHDLTPGEARAIIRRHTHDLRNMINCMDLEISCLLEDPAALAFEPAFQKIRHQLTLTERSVRSLSAKFTEPSLNLAAAADLFQFWRQQLKKLGRGPNVLWTEPSCDTAITVDFNAVVTVLCEICLHAKLDEGSSSLEAGISAEERTLTFFVREPASEKTFRETKPEAQQWAEWEWLTTISGGLLERVYDEAAAAIVTSLRFPVTL